MGAVSFRTLAQDAPLGAEPPVPAYVVNSTPATWGDVTDDLPAEAIEAGRGAAPEEMVLVAFAGTQSSSGHRITITDIWQADGELLVTVAEAHPAPEEMVEPATTLPFHVVAIAADDVAPATTTVRFQDENGAPYAEKVIGRP